MQPWELASAAFFLYTAAVALLPRRLDRRRRDLALAGSAAGIAVAVLCHRLPVDGVVHVWILPPLLLLAAYWTSGLLFVAPMPAAESWLRRVDAALRVERQAARTPRPAAEVLEVAYSGVYPLVPLAPWLALASGVPADRFWTVVLVTDFVCFGCLPWIQTRPPRAFMTSPPWRSSWRRINAGLLNASVRVNTFPSGHAAEALAAALLVSSTSPAVAGWMFFNAAAISAGAVYGRYHYAADAFAGWLVAWLVWWLAG
jgi:membrane-associated phospholipid phosphatase